MWEEGGGGGGIFCNATCSDSASLSCLACKMSAGKIPSSEAEWKVKSNLRHIFKANCRDAPRDRADLTLQPSSRKFAGRYAMLTGH